MTAPEQNRCKKCGRMTYSMDMNQRCEGCDCLVNNCDCNRVEEDMMGVRQIPMFGVDENLIIRPGAFDGAKEVPVTFDAPEERIPIGKAKVVDDQIIIVLDDNIDPRVQDIIYGSSPEFSKWSIAPKRKFIKEEIHELRARPSIASPPIPLTEEVKEKLNKLLEGFKEKSNDSPGIGGTESDQ